MTLGLSDAALKRAEQALCYFALHGWPPSPAPGAWPSIEPPASWEYGDEAETLLCEEFARFVAGELPLLGESEIARCHHEGTALAVWASLAAYRASGGVGVLIGDWNAALGLWLSGSTRLLAEDAATAAKLAEAFLKSGQTTPPTIRVRRGG